MNLREILKPVLVEWPMSDNLDPISFEINRLVSQLDDVAYAYEVKWGAGYLEATAASTNPDLAAKWQSQVDKLNDAISSRDIATLRAIVDGCRRGYSRLEENAYSHGLKPKDDPVIFSYNKGSTIFRVVRLVQDEWRAKHPGEDNVVVLSCEAMCRVYPKAWFNEYKKIEEKKDAIGTVSNAGYDWDTGDESPWK